MVQFGDPYISGTVSSGLRTDDTYLGSKITGVITPIGQLTGSIATGLKNRPYEGPYNVASIPYVDQQLNTKNKVAEADIVVKAIPFLRITAEDGGEIAIIGQEAS